MLRHPGELVVTSEAFDGPKYSLVAVMEQFESRQEKADRPYVRGVKVHLVVKHMIRNRICLSLANSHS